MAAVLLLAGCTTVVDGQPVGLAASGASTSSTSGTGDLPDFTKGVIVGSGPVEVISYDDLACPHCAELEVSFAPVIAKYLASGRVRFRFIDLSFLDDASGGSHYSSHAANASLCAAQVGTTQYLDFKKAILAAQPQEGTPGLSNAQIIVVAGRAGIASPDYATCVTSGRFARQVAAIDATNTKSGAVTSVPTVLVANVKVTNPTGARIARAIDAVR